MATSQTFEDELNIGGPVNVPIVRDGPIPELASPAEVAHMMAQRDEAEMMAAIMGEVVDKWFYEFNMGGTKVEGVGVTGAMEFSRIRGEQGFPIRFPVNQIRIFETTLDGERGIQATVVARDGRTGTEGLGVAFYPHYIEVTRNKNTPREIVERVKDRFADRKAVAVAKRNAVLDLIPEAQIISALKARAQIAKVNEARMTREREAQEAAARQRAPRIPAVSGEQFSESVKSADPYAGNAKRLPDSQPAGDEPAFRHIEKPFGETKGTKLCDMTDKDLNSSLDWASDKQKYPDWIVAAEKELIYRKSNGVSK